MDLRELKREVQTLPDLSECAETFQTHWIKPLRSNTNKTFPFLNRLPAETKSEINVRLLAAQKNLSQIKQYQLINQKLTTYSHYLIELKLTTLNGNKTKFKFIAHQLLHDEFLKLQNVIMDIKDFEENIVALSKTYQEVNKRLEQNLSLDESISVMDLPHQKYLLSLIDTCKKQKLIVRQMSRHLAALVK
ncbi:MAG: hypothetical protein AABW48_04365 [Nanoarchaeota archaeon]